MGTNRLEAFSDGVIAVAITLLVLNIAVPEVQSGHSLGHALLDQWSQYAAYVVSFVTIGIVWINHHAMISRLEQADQSILFLNLLLLLTIAVLPFATDLMAHYLRADEGESVAAAVYAGCFLLMSTTFVALNRHILLNRAHMMAEPLSAGQRRGIVRTGATGIIPYAVGVAVAFVSPYATLGICAALGGFYALPVASRGPQRG